MNISTLENIGLSPSEAKSYLSCLELGSALASDIAKRANLNRSNCYEALNRLISKGLVSTIKKENKLFFEAVEPKQLLELAKKRENELSKLMPELEKHKKIAQSIKAPQEAVVFEGYDGIKAVFEDILNILNKNDEYLVFGAVDVPKVFERYLVHWTKKRADKKIKMNIIYHEEAKNFISQTKNLPLTTIKVLPRSYITPAAVNVYGDKTATIVWTEKPIAFVVKNKEYTESFRNYFKLLWKIAK